MDWKRGRSFSVFIFDEAVNTGHVVFTTVQWFSGISMLNILHACLYNNTEFMLLDINLVYNSLHHEYNWLDFNT